MKQLPREAWSRRQPAAVLTWPVRSHEWLLRDKPSGSGSNSLAKKKCIVKSVLGSASRQSRRSGHEVETHWLHGALALRHWLPCFLQPCICCRLGAQHCLVSPGLREFRRLMGSVSIAAQTVLGQYLEQIYRKQRGLKSKLLGRRATSK